MTHSPDIRLFVGHCVGFNIGSPFEVVLRNPVRARGSIMLKSVSSKLASRQHVEGNDRVRLDGGGLSVMAVAKELVRQQQWWWQ